MIDPKELRIGSYLSYQGRSKKVVDTEKVDVIHFDYWLDQDDGWCVCKHSSDEFKDVQDLGVCVVGWNDNGYIEVEQTYEEVIEKINAGDIKVNRL
jgi:hypothetical protein